MKTARSFEVPIGVSARHVHLSDDHIRALYGCDLHVFKNLSQIGEFAAQETLTIATTVNAIHKVRVLGPPRKTTQVELSSSDAFYLGLTIPLRLSGNLDETPGVTLIGSKGSVQLETGVIVAARHLHMTPMEATRYELHQNDCVEAIAGKQRRCVFSNIVVRISPKAQLELHLDTDEANAAGVKTGDFAQIVLSDSNTVTVTSDHHQYICSSDILDAARHGKSIKLQSNQRITEAALELAKTKGVDIIK
ncbi:phosphate propanoyltransferase [bacterium]|nr:phosphate propanoyltransferase [candidate division CSSED10-310 bacterium]